MCIRDSLSTPPRWRWPYNGRGGYIWSSRTAVGCSHDQRRSVREREVELKKGGWGDPGLSSAGYCAALVVIAGRLNAAVGSTTVPYQPNLPSAPDHVDAVSNQRSSIRSGRPSMLIPNYCNPFCLFRDRCFTCHTVALYCAPPNPQAPLASVPHPASSPGDVHPGFSPKTGHGTMSATATSQESADVIRHRVSNAV